MHRIIMEPTGAFGYRAEVPELMIREGLLEYAVTVHEGPEAMTHPGGDSGHPHRWDFTGTTSWQVPVVPSDAAIALFDARRDLAHVLYPHPSGYVEFRTDVVAGSEPGTLALSAVVEDLAPVPHHFALRTFLPPERRTRLDDVPAASVLRIRARAARRESDRMQVALVERDGTAWGTALTLSHEWREYAVPLSALVRTPLALLPRPYPLFLPYFFEGAGGATRPDIAHLDGLQLSVGADLFADGDRDGPHDFEIERVVLDWNEAVGKPGSERR
jgi:hypothetical protein